MVNEYVLFFFFVSHKDNVAEHGKFANFIQQCLKDNIPKEKIEFLFNYTMDAYKELECK